MTKTSKPGSKPQRGDAQAPAERYIAANAPQAPAVKPERRQTKVQEVVALLRRPEGACVADIMTVTGWQAHSVRGALSGAVKKGLSLAVESEKVDGVRVYRIADAASS